MTNEQLNDFIAKAAKAADLVLRIKSKAFAAITPEDVGILCGQTYGMAMAITALCSAILAERNSTKN
jgi:hypothetical protein